LKPVLLLSNGHGEDLSGATLGRQLVLRGVAVEALPLVGHGQAYRQAGITVLGPTRDFSTGGLGYTSLAGRLTDLREGQFTYVLRLLGRLWRRRRRYQLVVAVGDLVPVLGAWLTGQESAVYLVAYSSHYEGRLRLPWPCGWLLKRPRVRAVWSRDQLTADDLSEQLGRPVDFLGNPFLDPLLEGVPATAADHPDAVAAHGTAASRPVVAVLPGSRLPEALGNLTLLLGVLERLPAATATPGGEPILRAAMVAALEPGAIAAAAPLGWHFVAGDGAAGLAPAALQREGRRLELHWNRFAAVLASCDVVLAMSGTASEQAVALARPVLQLAGPGPQFTEGFAEAQRRLLGPGVRCAPGPVGQPDTLAATARLLRGMLDWLADPVAGPSWRRELEAIAAERLGATGGSDRIASVILEILDRPQQARQGE
jgi:uncharacterized protein (TIGR03492 family)